MASFQEWVRQCTDLVGSQAKVAARIREEFGIPCTQQAIAKLMKGKSPARTSGYSVHLYALTGVPPPEVATWLRRPTNGVQAGPTGATVLTGDTEVGGMKYSEEALEVARAFMELNGRDRRMFARQIITKALQESAPTDSPKVEDLRRPDTKPVKR